MNIIKRIRRNPEIQRVAENSVSLTILSFINYGFPIFLIPYLTRVLGTETYGLYAFVLAVISYFTLIVRFGFDFSATKQLAIIRDDKTDVNKLFSLVLLIRLMLMLICALLLVLLAVFVPKIHQNSFLFFLGIGVFVGNGLIPVWFFQGMENMKLMTLANFVTRLCSTVLIVIFVKESQNCSLAIGFQSIGYMFGGIFSLLLVYFKFGVRFVFPSVQEVVKQIKSSWHLFLSNVGMNFYRESNVVILGFLTNYQYVGYYAAAEKIVKALQTLLLPFVQALFPFFGRRLNNESKVLDNLRYMLKLGKMYGGVLCCIAVVVAILSPWGVHVFLGKEYYNSILNIQVLSGVIVFGSLNYFFGIVGLVNMGFEKEFSRCVWVSGVTSVVLSFILSYLYHDLGAAITMTTVECILFLQVILVFVKRILK